MKKLKKSINLNFLNKQHFELKFEIVISFYPLERVMRPEVAKNDLKFQYQ